MSDNSYPRESEELVRFDTVSVNGVPTTAFTYQLQRKSERPSASWLTPLDVDGVPGFLLTPVSVRGWWVVWVRISQAGQNIVVEAGEIERT